MDYARNMPQFEHYKHAISDEVHEKSHQAKEFAYQAERLAQFKPSQENDDTGSTQAVEAKFVTAHDPVIETSEGGRLPAIPVEEAIKLNQLRDELDGRTPASPPRSGIREGADGSVHGALPQDIPSSKQSQEVDAPLREAIPPSRTNPLFPPMPMHGPPNLMRTAQCLFFRGTSAVLSFCFLLTIVAGAAFTSIPKIFRRMQWYATLRNPDRRRPFYEEEKKRRKARKATERAWVQQRRGRGTQTPSGESQAQPLQDGEFIPLEGGPDPLVPDVRYYARRVGLEAETFDVQTEDGFIIELYHLYNPREYRPTSSNSLKHRSPDLFRSSSADSSYAETQSPFPPTQKRYPVLMIHGLLQSAGAYCANDDDSLAFFLAKSGYDVWLGNNRCGFHPRHTLLHYEDPRMWAWNIRQMGIMDLPALISRVLAETGFPKLALIAHSQGTTQTLVALAKEQRPDIGEKISVFCALAPAAYAGPLIGKIHLKIMSVISPGLFRLIFGIHAFIPLMMDMHRLLPAKFYSWMGYRVFSFLFNWSDRRWDRGLRDRMFQFAPVYVSSESMRWWLGRECFAKQKCILATRDEGVLEDKEDEEDDEVIRRYYVDREPHVTERRKLQRNLTSFHCQALTHQHHDSTRGKYSWYNHQFPPLALWVCGADDLVDGRRLLRRFDRGREPAVRIVHKKIIEGYEHLDVIWAMDAIEKVGKEVREVIWRTVDSGSQARCRVPVGCNRPLEEDAPPEPRRKNSYQGPPERSEGLSKGDGGHGGHGRRRMESISEVPGHSVDEKSVVVEDEDEPKSPTHIDATRGEWAKDVKEDHEKIENAQLANSDVARARRMSELPFIDLGEKGNPLG